MQSTREGEHVASDGGGGGEAEAEAEAEDRLLRIHLESGVEVE
jgi:hypothetical protein